MTDDEEKKIERELKEQREKEASSWANVPSMVWIGIIVATLGMVFYSHLTTMQWVIWLLAMALVIYVFSLKSSKKVPLTEPEGKAHLKQLLDKKMSTGEIPPNNRYEVSLVSSYPPVDDVAKEYYFPFYIIDENNIPREWIARMDNHNMIGNTVYAKCPEGFWGTEKPAIKKVLPESFMDLKKHGLDKLIWGRLMR